VRGVAIEFDTSTEFGERAQRRFETDVVGWLTTVSPKGSPVPSPIWFLWDGETFLMYSQPHAPRIRNITANPRVSLNLDGDSVGGNIVIVSGTAAVSDDPPAPAVPAYMAKYATMIEEEGWTPESFAADYSTPVRITPTRLRGH
jgi:PPOX class probable F420-dependent enzyme